MLFKWYFELQELNCGKVLVMLCAHLTSAAWQGLFMNGTKYLGACLITSQRVDHDWGECLCALLLLLFFI